MFDLIEKLTDKTIERIEKYESCAEFFFTDGTSFDASVSGTEEVWLNFDVEDFVGKTIRSAELRESLLVIQFDDCTSASIDASGTEFSWLHVSGCNL